MPNENDNKLVTLADLGVAYDELNDNKKNVQMAVSDPTASGTAVAFIDSISQNAQGVIASTKKTVADATQSAAGLMSANDKTKLDGIASGAQVNSITGVKGNAESTYRQGNVNLTPENIGAFGASNSTNLAMSVSIPANGTTDITIPDKDNYMVMVMGYNVFTANIHDGFYGQREVYFFPKAMNANQYAYITPPDTSWRAWFTSDTVLHVENKTANAITFRVDGIN